VRGPHHRSDSLISFSSSSLLSTLRGSAGLPATEWWWPARWCPCPRRLLVEGGGGRVDLRWLWLGVPGDGALGIPVFSGHRRGGGGGHRRTVRRRWRRRCRRGRSSRYSSRSRSLTQHLSLSHVGSLSSLPSL
jgi:hypothetical protein